jgi:hypothetical protein
MLISKFKLYIACVVLTASFSFCVNKGFPQVVQTVTDKKDILIGEQVKLTFKATFPVSTSMINWVKLPDSLVHFEIVNPGMRDSSIKDGSKLVEQTIILTSFDSGRWEFPSLPVQFAGQPERVLFTDSFYVNVSYSPPDSTNELRDIKPIINVYLVDYTLYLVIGGVILLLFLIYLLFRHFNKHKKERPAVKISNLSPIDEAMAALKELSQYNLNDPADTKIYHSKLSYIFKNYLGRKQNNSLLDQTTGDLLINMRDMKMHAEDQFKLATALRITDAVKFAKFQPDPADSDEALQKVKEVIMLIERSAINNEPQTTNM